jgi:hypothetical protein
MANGWTWERRRRQGERIRIWKPWERSTGPRTQSGRDRFSQNAFKGGTRVVLRALAKALRGETELLTE